jgi:ATP-dependent Clp protease ATP-binding subunit ClpA
MFERFTDQARDVVVHAQEESRQLGHDFIGTEHLLLALLDPSAGATAAVLAHAGVDATAVRAAVQRNLTHPGTPLTEEDAEALKSIGIDLDRVLSRLEATLGSAALTPACEPRRRGLFRRRRRRQVRGYIRFTGRSKKVLELSLREAIALRHGHIGSEHILLGLIREGEGLAAQVLVQQGVDLKALRAATLRALDQAA